MKILGFFTLIAASIGLLATPAHASDHKKKDKHHHDGYYHHPSVNIGIVAPGRTYYDAPPYYGHSSTVIVERERPVYYERSGYSGGAVGIDVQRGLARRGYYRGPIDGDIGPGSRSAIRAFQDDHGMEPSGRITRSLLDALR